MKRKPADLTILKSLEADATRVETEIVDVFSHKDDYICDLENTPFHLAVLDLYSPSDADRPNLEQLVEFVDNAKSPPPPPTNKLDDLGTKIPKKIYISYTWISSRNLVLLHLKMSTRVKLHITFWTRRI